MPRHAKPVPFTDTVACKTLVLTAVTAAAAGVAASGGAVATHTLGAHIPPGVYIGVMLGDHADPYHNDPGGEWVHVEDAPTLGTASVNHLVVGPGA